MTNRRIMSTACVIALGAAAWLLSGSTVPAKTAKQSDHGNGGRVRKGFAIAPVPLDLEGRNRGLVGAGSYLVNAVGVCADCHSCPTYAPGHNPFEGGDGALNTANYLAGGVAFGPFVSANLTPDDEGRPAGLTLAGFIQTIRTGHSARDGHALSVMPWPVYRNMNDRDLTAIYEYLSSIPHAEPGTCGGAGE